MLVPNCKHASRLRRPINRNAPVAAVKNRSNRTANAQSIPCVSSTSSATVQSGFASCNKGDLLQITHSDGQVQYGEVVRAFDDASQSAIAIVKGHVLSLEASSLGFQATDMGAFPQPEDPLFNGFTGWREMYSQALQQPAQPPLGATGGGIQQVDVVHSLRQLQAEVAANPSFWCDGTGPSDPPLTPLQQALLNTGELLALEYGHRGVCLVQLHVGWGGPNAVQPVLNPFVTTMLHRLFGNKDIQVLMSPAAGGLGLTAVLCARKEPYRSWGRHLLTFGAQAAVVAESPYYKLLIGRMMGYKEQNILAHIQAKHGQQHPTPEVVAAVDADMRKLSNKKAQIPWKTAAAAPGRQKRR